MADLALLVSGGRGQLGSDLAARASGYVHAPGSAELDVTDPAAVADAVDALVAAARAEGLPPVVVNAAAYAAVDAAEENEERAFAVNAQGPWHLACACLRAGVPLVHVSTDYVFSGDTDRPYRTDDSPGPRSVYGRSKLAGERAVHVVAEYGARAWVVRTAWLYGPSGGNFVKTMARLERERDKLSVVDDQTGSPTYTADLADGLLALAARVVGPDAPAQRLLHATGGGSTTWYGFARAVFEELGADPDRVRPCTTAEFPRPAPRPAYSVLSDDAWREAGLPPLRHWRDALAAAFADHGPALRG
ncbi:NAD(P)-dependent oxidoreductase [Gandjariella thermophila]|uniref:dTDP-4-dehydrorhamnose reductase n=1 Tax=Gandjariella thermophila TaxID=1931992 RepID=A0A4D4J7Z7_9PSEU|nr:NAD(P)-dependent oxidoreductase [Gandjariella thermophila]